MTGATVVTVVTVLTVVIVMMREKKNNAIQKKLGFYFMYEKVRFIFFCGEIKMVININLR